MTEIAISTTTLQDITASLSANVERGAALYLRHDMAGNRYLVEAYETAKEADCLSASSIEITFAPQFLTRVTRVARERQQHLALLHTHIKGVEDFSSVDDHAEQMLADFMHSRNPERRAFSMVLCDGRLIARLFGATEYLPVRSVGPDMVVPEATAPLCEDDDKYDRQVRAFGDRGQAILKSLTIAIVGLGGTGSLAAQQLAHLGVGSFILIDPDVIEDTNLNRVVGANPGSVGLLKVDVAAQMIRQINPRAHIQIHRQTVISEVARKLLCSADGIMMCTDSHASRAFLSELAYQYLIPAFDVGVSINAQCGTVVAVTGRAQMLTPSLPCLLCCNALDANAIREELMTPEQKAADPYFNEGGVRQPAVISINSTMVSLAITMFLAAFTGIPSKPRWLSYNGLTGNVKTLATTPDLNCTICGPKGNIAAGDSRLLSFI
jgi:molybdopterin/thiamine biosynthesis adenylyltransferase